jgi:hypothetical protein
LYIILFQPHAGGAAKATSKKPSVTKPPSDAKQQVHTEVAGNSKSASWGAAAMPETDDPVEPPRPVRPMVRRGAISAEAFQEDDLDKMTIDRKVGIVFVRSE